MLGQTVSFNLTLTPSPFKGEGWGEVGSKAR